MRRIFSSALIALMLTSLIPLTQAESGYYLVSAYYSPEPGQDFYINGSYEDEIRMNGEGKTTASGAPVRIGAIAAPRTIAYNTRIAIDQDITIKGQKIRFTLQGTVLDRGGAITTASKLPRLDIYMGSGQKGLCRAINFGVQTVYASFDDTESDDTSTLAISSDCNNPNKSIRTTKAGVFDPFTSSISSATKTDDVKTVQRLFQRLEVLQGTVDGVYDQEFRDSVFAFQKKYGIVKNATDDGAGVYGPRTRTMLKSVLEGNTPEPTAEPETETTPPAPTPNPETPKTPTTTDTTLPENGTSIFNTQVYDGSKSEDIRELQGILRNMGYFKYEADGLYNKRLVDSIYAFQLEKGIVSSVDDIGAGYYGPVTRQTLSEAYTAWKANIAKKNELIAKIESVRASRAATLADKKIWFESMVKKIPTLKVGQVHPEIRTLQILLKDLGYLDHKDTAIFGDLTRGALARYQLDLKVIDSLSSPYAGVLGDRTRAAIAADLTTRWEKTDTTGLSEIQTLEKELKALGN